MTHSTPVVSVLMPCLNEVQTLADCIRTARTALDDSSFEGEIVVADNGSTDGSQDLARSLGARVVDVPVRGYGAALRNGIEASQGTYVVMGDSDMSYDFGAVPEFVKKLEEGFDIVMGNRFAGGIKPGAMPFLHKYLGNPVLSFLGRLFFRSKIGDFHCGIRGAKRESLLGLDLKSDGMEFATEMIAKAERADLKIAEIPVVLSPDGRDRAPHLNTWRDGWRHLKFMLLFTPRWLFLYPGLLLFVSGLLGTLVLLLDRSLVLFGARLGIHSLLYCHVLLLVGLQCLLYFLLTKVVAFKEGYIPFDSAIERVVKFVSSDFGAIAGVVCTLAGFLLLLKGVLVWESNEFGDLIPGETMRLVIPAATLVLMGVELIAFFFISSLLLSIKERA